jgi:hypothetical protein
MSDQVKLEDIDLETMKADIEKLKQGNDAKAKALASETGSLITPGIIAAIKIEVFIDSFLDDNAKTVFAYNFLIRMRKELDDALKEVRQAQIVTPPSKLHIAR